MSNFEYYRRADMTRTNNDINVNIYINFLSILLVFLKKFLLYKVKLKYHTHLYLLLTLALSSKT